MRFKLYLKLSRTLINKRTCPLLFCFVLFVCGVTSHSRMFDAFGDIEDRVNTIELPLVMFHVGILEIKNGNQDNFIILSLQKESRNVLFFPSL